MMPIARILCPVDLSDCSRHALRVAVAVAKQYGASASALLVVPPVTPLIPAGDMGPYPLMALTAEDLARLQRELEMFVRDFAGEVPSTAAVAEGNVVAEIVRRAADEPADLIVMGTHGRSGFEHLVLGSVTERVLRKSPCPVLTVPPRAPQTFEAGGLFTRILCAVDFSPASIKAMEVAARLARDAGAHLSLAYVRERFPIDEPVMAGGPGTPQYDVIAATAARSRLHDSLPRAVLDLNPVTELVGEGKAYAEILRLAEQERADLLIIGAHGSAGGMHGFGSTTNQVVRRAACPVLVVGAA